MAEHDDTALKKYDAFLRYLAYENTVYWTRSNFFLVAHAGLLAFAARSLFPWPVASGSSVVGIVLGLGGVALWWMWVAALRAGEFWIHHWHTILKKLEPMALGDEIQAFRDWKPELDSPPRVSARQVARWPPRLFLALWLAYLGLNFTLLFFAVCDCRRALSD